MSDDPVTLHEGRWLRLRRRGTWEYCERTTGRDGMAVIIVAVTPDDEVLFVEQFRQPLQASTIEMPAGLVEETGWEPRQVDVLLTGSTSSGMSNERIAFVRARDLQRVGPGGGVAGENITVHAVPRATAPAWLMQQQARGCELDLKLWAGLWMIDRNPDGSPVA